VPAALDREEVAFCRGSRGHKIDGGKIDLDRFSWSDDYLFMGTVCKDQVCARFESSLSIAVNNYFTGQLERGLLLDLIDF
jgi:hypothetical protein